MGDHDAETIWKSLTPPAALVFIGFAGKLQAEVRIRQPDKPQCGLPPALDVAAYSRTCKRPPSTDQSIANHGGFVQLCETVDFDQPSTSSLLLEVPLCERAHEIPIQQDTIKKWAW